MSSALEWELLPAQAASKRPRCWLQLKPRSLACPAMSCSSSSTGWCAGCRARRPQRGGLTPPLLAGASRADQQGSPGVQAMGSPGPEQRRLAPSCPGRLRAACRACEETPGPSCGPFSAPATCCQGWQTWRQSQCVRAASAFCSSSASLPAPQVQQVAALTPWQQSAPTSGAACSTQPPCLDTHEAGRRRLERGVAAQRPGPAGQGL